MYKDDFAHLKTAYRAVSFRTPRQQGLIPSERARSPPPLRTHNEDFVDDSRLNRKRLFAKVITGSNSLVSINWKDNSQTLNCPCFIGIVMEWPCGGGTASKELLRASTSHRDKKRFAVDTQHQKQAVSCCCFHTLPALSSLTAKLAEEAQQRSSALFGIPLTQLGKSTFSSAQLFHLFSQMHSNYSSSEVQIIFTERGLVNTQIEC